MLACLDIASIRVESVWVPTASEVRFFNSSLGYGVVLSELRKYWSSLCLEELVSAARIP